MRILSLILIFIAIPMQSQTFFDAGLKGGFGGAFLINSNVFDDATFNHKFGTAYTVGGKVGFNFTLTHALTVEVMYAGAEYKHSYDFTKDGGEIDIHDRSIKASGLEFLALYRKNAAGQYIEIGGVYSILGEHSVLDSNVAFDNSKTWIDENRIGAVLGFGSNIAGGGMSLLSLGLRLRYDLTDLWLTETDATAFFNSNRNQANSTEVYTDYKKHHLLLLC